MSPWVSGTDLVPGKIGVNRIDASCLCGVYRLLRQGCIASNFMCVYTLTHVPKRKGENYTEKLACLYLPKDAQMF